MQQGLEASKTTTHLTLRQTKQRESDKISKTYHTLNSGLSNSLLDGWLDESLKRNAEMVISLSISMALSVLSKHWAENDLLTRYFDADFLLQERINLQMLQRKKQQIVIAC